MKNNNKTAYAGIDLGTSGCRLIVIDQAEDIVFEDRIIYTDDSMQTPTLWWQSVSQLILNLPQNIAEKIAAISIDGTSGTLLLTDAQGNPTSPALLYNDTCAIVQAERIKAIAPENSGSHGAGSSLSKLLFLLENYPNNNHAYALHQADWISNKLMGKFGFSDENNCLKLGFDSVKQCWSDWMKKLAFPLHLLPKVSPAGELIGTISQEMAKQLRLPNSVKIIAGTTDSIAAFIATGASELGEAITSLGSTLAIKLISDRPIFSSKMGVYSHKLGEHWLVGGASNTGGAVLRKFFSVEEMRQMTAELNPTQLLNLGYYPLTKAGERFPVADPDKQPILYPRPDSNVQFFQAILEGIADIEVQAYKSLKELGSPYPNSIFTVGGGNANHHWTRIREAKACIAIKNPKYSEAAYGSALLAARATKKI